MEWVLTVYSREAYQEYSLGPGEQGTAEVRISGGGFSLPDDLRVAVQFRDGRPEFLPSGAFSLRRAGEKRRFPLPLEPEAVYFLTANSGKRLVLTARPAVAPFFRTYELKAGTPVFIGSGPENQIRYSGGKTVSRVHAVLHPESGSCRLEDRSCNGVYVNHRRVEGSAALAWGDRIHIAGLTLVYSGDGIAMDHSAAGVQVGDGLHPAEKNAADGVRAMEAVSGQAGSEGESGAETAERLDFGDETVFEAAGRPDFGDETVFEAAGRSDFGDETVFEAAGRPGFGDETVFEAAGRSDSEDETMLEDAERPGGSGLR